MYTLTAADFADTGQWRLLLNIGRRGLAAFLQNTLHPEIELQELCKVEWEEDKSVLCRKIEDAVYNYPRLLDDFATKIVLYDPCALLIPRDIAEACTGSEEDLYNSVYNAEASDIMSDFEGDITAVWCPAPGVKSFLMRTFPGSRITCNLLEKIRESEKNFEKKENLVAEGQEVRLFKYEREGEVDLVLMEGDSLLSASTHDVKEPGDIERLEKKLFEAYDIERT